MTTAGAGGERSLLLRGSGLNLAGAVVQSGANFLTILLLERILGSTVALGAFLTAVAGINLAARLGELGTGTGLLRFVARSGEARRDVDIRAVLAVAMGPALVVSVVLAVVIASMADVLAPLISDAGAEATVASYVRAFAIMVPVLALLAGASQGTRAFGTMAPAVLHGNVVRPGLQVLGLTTLWAAGVAATAAVGAAYWLPYLVAAIGITVSLRRFVRATQPTRPPRRVRDGLAARYWRFTAPRAVASVFAAVIEWGDALLIAGIASTAQAGIYAASTRFLVVGRAIQLAAVNALRPQINRLLEDGRIEAAQRVYRLAATWSVALAWPWFLTVMVYAEELLTVLGPEFVVAATALRILCAAWLLATAVGPVSAVLEMAGRSTWSMLDLGLAMVVNISLNVVLIPPLGLTGAAIAWAASVAVNNLLPMWQVARNTGMTPIGPTTRRVAVIALVTAGGLWAVESALPGGSRGLLHVAVALVTTGLCYVGLLWRFGPELDVASLVARVLDRQGRGGGGS